VSKIYKMYQVYKGVMNVAVVIDVMLAKLRDAASGTLRFM